MKTKLLFLFVFLLAIGGNLSAQTNNARMLAGVNSITVCPYIIQAVDQTKLDVFTIACVVTLPAASTFGPGVLFSAKNDSTGNVQINAASGTIDGSPGLTLSPGQGVDIYTDSLGKNYYTQPGSGTGGGGGGGGGITPPAGDIGGSISFPTVVSTHLAAPLPVAQGGTGTATPGLVNGSNVTITGAWPNQTIAASPATGCGGGVINYVCAVTSATTSAPTALLLPLGNGGAPVSSCPYTVGADTGTSTTDRGTVIELSSGSACAITLNDPTTAGIGSGFPVKFRNVGTGLVTVTSGGVGTFSFLTGSPAGSAIGGSSFPLSQYQYTTCYADSANWRCDAVIGSGSAWQNQGTPIGTPLTINCSTNMTCSFGSNTVTLVATNTAATAWSAITAATNANAGTFLATGNTWNFSGATSFIAPVGAGFAPTVSGSHGYNSTNNSPVFGSNGSTLTWPQNNAGSANSFLTAYNWLTGVFSVAQPSFTNLSGSATCGQLPALTGDTTSSAGSCATANVKVNGLAIPASASLTGTNGSSQFIAATAHGVSVPLTCADSSGSGTAQSCTTTPSFSLASKDAIIYTTTTTNTGDVTVAVNGGGAIHVRKWLGNAVLSAGDLPANTPVLMVYDGSFLEISTIGNAPGGSGNTTSAGLTSGYLPVANGANSIVNSNCNEGITTANTFTCTDTAGGSFTQVATTGAGPWAASGTEGAAASCPAATAGSDILCNNSTTHRQMLSNNGATYGASMINVMSQAGDMIIGGAVTAGVALETRLPAGTSTQVLVGGVPATWGQVNLSNMVSATLGCGNMPALTGDTFSSVDTCATTTAKINGVAFPASAGVIGSNASSQPVIATAHGVSIPRACADTSGSGTVQVCNTVPTFTPVSGDEILYSTTTTNTGDVTVNVNSLGAKHIRKWLASSTLAPGDLVGSAVPVILIYDGTYWEISTIGNAPAAGGSVTSIATTSPISGGTITTTGTLSCPTCVTSAAALTSTQLMTGAGSQASQTNADWTIATHSLTSGASGILDLHSAAIAGFLMPGANATGLVKVTTSTGATSSVSSNRTLGWSYGDVATGSALTTSEVGYITVPFACTIVGYHIMADAGTVTIKTARVNGGTALPTIGSNSISTSGVALSSGTKVDSSTVTDFTSTAIAANDTLGFFITAVATAKQITFQLDCAQ